MVIHWDMSWFESTHGQKEVVSMQYSNVDLIEISRFAGHEVRLFRLFLSRSSHRLSLFRTLFTPFLYLPMVIGLHLVHRIKRSESGMRILLHCNVSCMVMARFVLLISVVPGIILQSGMRRA